MCDCCKKIIVQTNTTVGVSADFVSDSEFSVVKNIPYLFNYTALSDGDYILQLELDLTFSNLGDSAANALTSQLIKNNSIEINTNARHRLNLGFSLTRNYETPYTHNCKIVGVTAGDTIGFQLDSSDGNVLVNNISITVLKTA